MNFESSRVMIKIKFIEAILLTNDNSAGAFELTLETKRLAKKHFGVKSSFYLDMVLNEAYLQR